MLPKVASITPGPSLNNNTSMAKTSEQDLQIVTIGQLKEVIEQIN